ncbi:hypothetical protein DMN91_004541 [Ooceraea biroi]|uniref:Uncharacterized protein n=1 Tax=Ooceraea biroi TaxID=2015173 RepID=A0A3L8DPV6_OOCBI|nr:hypothetical protein DMN91_004541 [Ooceraea biroi]
MGRPRQDESDATHRFSSSCQELNSTTRNPAGRRVGDDWVENRTGRVRSTKGHRGETDGNVGESGKGGGGGGRDAGAITKVITRVIARESDRAQLA